MEEYRSASDRIAIVTYEFYSGKWNYTLSHMFPGETDEEVFNIVKAHMTTDSFLNASMTNKIDETTYEGVFPYKGGNLILRSKIYRI